MNKIYYILVLLFLNVNFAFGQLPHYLNLNTETGLPSNEVYSIIQDAKGFIWIGCDAGLFKFDGVRYIPFKSTTQKSKSITGLKISNSGRIYCYNFQSQLFYIEEGKLKELKIGLTKINQLTCNKKNELFVSHARGISKFNETTNKWTHYRPVRNSPIQISSSVIESNNDEVNFITTEGIGSLKNNNINIIQSTYCKPAGSLFMRKANEEAFIFSVQDNSVFKIKDKQITEIKNTKLNAALHNKKITNAVFLA